MKQVIRTAIFSFGTAWGWPLYPSPIAIQWRLLNVKCIANFDLSIHFDDIAHLVHDCERVSSWWSRLYTKCYSAFCISPWGGCPYFILHPVLCPNNPLSRKLHFCWKSWQRNLDSKTKYDMNKQQRTRFLERKFHSYCNNWRGQSNLCCLLYMHKCPQCSHGVCTMNMMLLRASASIIWNNLFMW